MTEQEQKSLAREWCEGRVVFSTHVPEGIINIVFMPLIFLNDEQRQKMIDEKVYAFYGKMEDAGPTGINGYPIFSRMFLIQEPDFLKVEQYAKEYDAFQKQFAAGDKA